MVIVKMNDEGIKSPEQIKTFLEGLGNLSLEVCKKDRNAWIARTLRQTGYFLLPKKDKTIVFKYLMAITNLSRQQLTNLTKNIGRII